MTIFNKWHKFLGALFLGLSCMVNAKYYTREINLSDDFEVTQVAQLLFYKEHMVRDSQTGVERSMTDFERQSELDLAKLEVKQKALDNKKIFICVSTEDSKIYAALCCQTGYRKTGMVEYTRLAVDKSSNSKNWSKNIFDVAMLSMTSYAETFYRSLSMKSIVIHVISKDDAAFYTKHGYRILNDQEANELYYTTADNIAFCLGLPFIIALFPFYLIYKACDWGIFYKEL